MGSYMKWMSSSCRLFAVGMACALALPAVAEDPPKEAPKQKTGNQQEAAPPAGSLAAAASRIKLQDIKGDDAGSLVINDHNVKSSGKGAAVSQGSGALAGSAAALVPAGHSSATSASANAAAEELQAQKVKVENMEAQLADYDRQLAEPSTDPHYPKYRDAPQFRSPGVIDPAQGKRDEYAKRLEEERAKLEELERIAKQAGVKNAQPAPETPRTRAQQ